MKQWLTLLICRIRLQAAVPAMFIFVCHLSMNLVKYLSAVPPLAWPGRTDLTPPAEYFNKKQTPEAFPEFPRSLMALTNDDAADKLQNPPLQKSCWKFHRRTVGWLAWHDALAEGMWDYPLVIMVPNLEREANDRRHMRHGGHQHKILKPIPRNGEKMLISRLRHPLSHINDISQPHAVEVALGSSKAM